MALQNLRLISESYSYKRIWQIAYPIMVGYFALNLITFADIAFLGRLGDVEVGAGGNAALYFSFFAMLIMGMSTAIQIIIGRRNGETNYNLIGRVFYNGLFVLIIMSVICFLVMKHLFPGLLDSIMRSDKVFKATTEYWDYRIYGIFFTAIMAGCRAFYVGVTKTKILTGSTIIMALVNISLDYCLIFGNYGFPELGIQGAAIASVIAEAVATVYFLVYTFITVDFRKYGFLNFKNLSLTPTIQILKTGWPLFIQSLVTMGAWAAFFTIIEQMSDEDLAISQYLKGIYFLLMVPIMGWGIASNTVVSNLIGEKKPEAIIPLLSRVSILSFLSVLLCVIVGLIFKEQFIGLFTKSDYMIQATIPSFYVISGSALVFAIAMVWFNGLSGTGDTRTSMLVEVVNIAIYLGATYIIAIHLDSSIAMVWSVEYVYFGLLLLFSYVVLKKGWWRKLSV